MPGSRNAEPLRLVRPRESLREETIDFLREFRQAGQTYGSDVWDEVHRDYATPCRF